MGLGAASFAILDESEKQDIVSVAVNGTFYKKVQEEAATALEAWKNNDPAKHSTPHEFQMASVKLFEQQKSAQELLDFLNAIRGYLSVQQKT